MGILIMAYYNPHYNWVYLIPLIYPKTTRGPFFLTCPIWMVVPMFFFNTDSTVVVITMGNHHHLGEYLLGHFFSNLGPGDSSRDLSKHPVGGFP